MSRDPIPTHFFVLVVVRQKDKFLLIKERKHGQRWYIPAGRVEPLEDFFTAARRETLEEAGFRIRLKRILRIEHLPFPVGRARIRVVFLAEPEEPIEEPQGGPDALAAVWVTPNECGAFDLRDESLPPLFRYAGRKDAGFPLDGLAFEGDPFPGVGEE